MHARKSPGLENEVFILIWVGRYLNPVQVPEGPVFIRSWLTHSKALSSLQYTVRREGNGWACLFCNMLWALAQEVQDLGPFAVSLPNYLNKFWCYLEVIYPELLAISVLIYIMHELSKMPQKRKNTLIQGISFVNAGHTNPQKKKKMQLKYNF